MEQRETASQGHAHPAQEAAATVSAALAVAAAARDAATRLVGGGASNITMYAALSCNWWNPPVIQLMTAFGVGPNVSFFGLKGLGSNIALMNQPSSPGFSPQGDRADNPFYGVPSDVNVPQR